MAHDQAVRSAGDPVATQSLLQVQVSVHLPMHMSIQLLAADADLNPSRVFC